MYIRVYFLLFMCLVEISCYFKVADAPTGFEHTVEASLLDFDRV